MTNEHANTRRNIASQGTSRASTRQSPVVRRALLRLVPAAVMLLGACGGASSSDSEPTRPSTVVAQSAAPTTSDSTNDATSTTLDVASTTMQPAVDTTQSVAPTTTVSGRPVSTTVATMTSNAAAAPTTIAPTTTSRVVGSPRLAVSQASGLDAAGTRVTVRGTGYDVAKGVYVIVCNQAAWTDSRRCVGGVNIDGSSPVSEWVSSNPPGYAKGLTVPFANDGSFSITLLVRAIGDAIDCTKEQCGVVTFADHTRRDDRSQDAFVPISFKSGG